MHNIFYRKFFVRSEALLFKKRNTIRIFKKLRILKRGKCRRQGREQWCSKTTMLQDQDHLFFQDQDRSGQDQDHFFKTKTKPAFFKDRQLINPRPQKTFPYKKISPVILVLPSHAGIMPVTEKTLLITCFLVRFCII